MNKALLVVALIFSALVFGACSHHHHHHHTTKVKKVPPGHAKKMTGSQSAKAYAPGQKKKRVK